MAKLLFKLNNVPADEAQEVRQLLDDHQIDFYETPGGNWGISVEAIWLHDDSRLLEAKALLEEYQAERSRRVRAEYEQSRAQGEHPNLWQKICANPLPVIALMALAAAIIYFSVVPFFDLFHGN
ncbi:DUF6164 family protein [Porticoccaceae bacterium LTM1]|nr:DUF6164 family protein [Porticoccaceae bacterium LTM1]